MKKLIAAAVLYLLLLPVSYSMGWFHQHHDDGPPPPPPKTPSHVDRPGLSSPNIPSLTSPAPEPETYLVLIVGLVVVAWVIRNKMK
jgi:hypothetical protein